MIVTFIHLEALLLSAVLDFIPDPFEKGEQLRYEFTSGNESFVPVSNTARTTTHTRTGTTTDSSTSLQNPHGGAFVHLGKTAGSTLSVLLQNGCHSFMPHPCREVPPAFDSPANHMVNSYYHVPDFGLLPASQHDFYIVTTRDPFDRIVSAFVYEHIQNRLARNETDNIDHIKLDLYKQAYQCFPTLEAFCLLLGGKESNNFDYPYPRREVHYESCQDFARAAFHGKVRMMNHFYFGYQRIQSLLPSSRSNTIYVARQEHLWNDWYQINSLLLPGLKDKEEGKVPRYFPVLSSSSSSSDAVSLLTDAGNTNIRNTTILELQNKLPVTRQMDNPAARQSLCQALKDEYLAYFGLLQQAQNLQLSKNNDDALEASIQRAVDRCGIYLDMAQLVSQSKTIYTTSLKAAGV